LYNSVLNARIIAHLESTSSLHDAQHGFRSNRSAIDNIFMLTQTINARKRDKLDTYMLFLDIEKAYDSVWRAGLLYHLWAKGVTGRMFRVLAQMTDNPASMVMHKGAFSDKFQPGMGWEQGDTLATTMFNVHIDAVLQHVWDEHPGVPIPSNTPNQAGKLVALMYADDLAGLAGSVEELTTLIASTRAALTLWRLKASVKPGDGSKTAVMVVQHTQSRRQPVTAQHAWHWGQVEIPQVSAYKYLGAWLHNKGDWEEHITKRMHKANAAAGAQHTVMAQRQLPWRLRHLVLTTAVQPVLTHACQVWNKCTQAQRQRLDAWQIDLVRRIVHCQPTTSTACLQQELGIIPLHVSCDMWMLCYWHRLRTMPTDRLLHQVFTAWTGAHNPWQQTVNKLITEYGVDVSGSAQYLKGKFAKYVKSLAMARLQQLWAGTERRQQGAVAARYSDAFGEGTITTGLSGAHPMARKYFERLTRSRRGEAAELCMKLRLETLPLRCMHHTQRRQETMVAQQARQCCPLCKQAPETPAHFMLACPAYANIRATMMLHLTTAAPQLVACVQADHGKWRHLLEESAILTHVATRTGGAPLVAASIGATAAASGTWTGVAPLVAASAGAAAAVAAPGMRTGVAPPVAASAGAAAAVAASGPMTSAAVRLPIMRAAAMTSAATTAALTLSNSNNVQQQQQQSGAHSPRVVLPVVDYVVAAWRVRCSALAGRETNGGNAMV
jgi:hypothetical protein